MSGTETRAAAMHIHIYHSDCDSLSLAEYTWEQEQKVVSNVMY